MVKQGLSMASERAILEIETSSYHDWPWDIGSICKPPWHHFFRIFCYSIMILNYEPPFDVILWYLNDPIVWFQTCDQQ
jgi:hypothetical protein